jgi:hypothetical protein
LELEWSEKHGSKIACLREWVMVQYQEHHLGGGGHSHFGADPIRILHEDLLKIFVAGPAVLPPDHQFHVSESVVGIVRELRQLRSCAE